MARINKPDRIKKKKGSIPSIEAQAPPAKITFSFEFYDMSEDTYCISKWTQEQIRQALARLSDINSKTFNELRSAHYVYHFHEVEWARTAKKNGFTSDKAKHLNETAWQIALLNVNQQMTRVFGAYVNSVFYIVWFDLNHEIWPTQLRNT
jgi:hypothetical protein